MVSNMGQPGGLQTEIQSMLNRPGMEQIMQTQYCSECTFSVKKTSTLRQLSQRYISRFRTKRETVYNGIKHIQLVPFWVSTCATEKVPKSNI